MNHDAAIVRLHLRRASSLMVLPVGDENPTRRFPFVTIALIVVNVGVFVAFNARLPERALTCFVYRWSAVPRELLTFRAFPPLSTAGPICLGAASQKQVLLSAVTSMFLHANLAHIGFNMLFLWIFGNNVEDRLGHVTYAMYYLLGGLVSVYGFSLLNPTSTTSLLGASGAIAAVLGGYIVMFPRARIHTFVPFPLSLAALLFPWLLRSFWFFFAIVDLPSWLVLSFWFVTQLSSSSATARSGVAYEAHIVGFLAGVILTFVLRGHQRGQPPRRQPEQMWPPPYGPPYA